MNLVLDNKEHLIDNVWAFRFKPSEPLTWIPGQYIRVELPHDNPDEEGTKRWFTVSSPPYEGIVQITTRVTDSTFKQALSQLPIGGKLPLIEMPEGHFTWEDTDQPIVFVAGGIGITPFRSILKQRAHDHLPLSVTLIYGSRTEDIPFRDELSEWQQSDPNLKVTYVVGEPLTAEKLGELLPKMQESLLYLSGPEPMVQALSKDLEAHKVPSAQIKLDEFPNYDQTNY